MSVDELERPTASPVPDLQRVVEVPASWSTSPATRS